MAPVVLCVCFWWFVVCTAWGQSLRGMVQEISTELLEAFPGGAKLLIRLEGHDFPRITPKARFRLRHKAIKDLPPGTERSRVMVTTATLVSRSLN